MIVRSYTGRSVAEALEKVRGDLGDQALIVETRPWHEPGLLGRRRGYEVVAAGDHPDEASRPRRASAERSSRASTTNTLRKHSGTSSRAQHSQTLNSQTLNSQGGANQAVALETARAQRVHNQRRQDSTRQQTGHTDQAETAGLSLELVAIRRQLARLAAGHGTPNNHIGEDLALRLEDRELPAEMIAELDEAVSRAGDRLAASQRELFCARYLAHHLHCPGSVDWAQCRHLLMVGPTGVGKTTTLAKLAGDLVLRQQRKIALVTIDTYRVGAADQLETYADLLDVPCAVAKTPSQLGEVLERFRDYDNVLIDTAGRSPSDATRLHELRAFCRATPGIAVMLAVSATCGRAEFAAVVERFSMLPIEYGVLTKLDEAQAIGRTIGCLRRHRLPINYYTTGQEVPTDLEPATAGRLSNTLLEAAAPAA